MAQVKPTAAQRKVLEAMADGEYLQRSARGSIYDAFPTNRLMTVQTATVTAMWRNGWIAWLSEPSMRYVISDLGRAAIRKE